MHHLLHLEVASAFSYNPALVISIPYLLTGFIFDQVRNPGPRMRWWRKFLFGSRAIWVVLTLILAFWIGRNL